jgi:hypothetical protein
MLWGGVVWAWVWAWDEARATALPFTDIASLLWEIKGKSSTSFLSLQR